jgi:hypothetical protein
MVEHILEVYGASSAVFTFAFLVWASRADDGPQYDRTPHESLNTHLRYRNHCREREAISKPVPDWLAQGWPSHDATHEVLFRGAMTTAAAGQQLCESSEVY